MTWMYPKKKLRKRRGFYKLNSDAILEIFQHFTAVEADGAFILILVSLYWRRLTLASPILWKCIHIDDRLTDWFERAHVHAFLAGSIPLQITIRLPISKCDMLHPFLGRCKTLFLEIPENMSANDSKEAGHRLLHIMDSYPNCSVYWYSVGKELAMESRKPMAMELSHVTKLDLTSDGYDNAEDLSWDEDDNYEWVPRHSNGYQPLRLLKVYHILEIMRNAFNLQKLILSADCLDPVSSKLQLPAVTMPQLRDLEIRRLDANMNGNTGTLLDSVKCPRVETVYLDGARMAVTHAITSLGAIGHPSKLSLGVYDFDETSMLHSFLPTRNNMANVSYLELWIGGPTEEGLAAFFGSFPALISMKLRFKIPFYYDGDDMELPCVNSTLTSHLPEPPIIGGVGQQPDSIHCPSITCKFYGIIPNQTQLQILAIEASSLHFPHCLTPAGNVYPSLTTLTCTPLILLPFLSQHLLPLLHTIVLRWSGGSLMGEDPDANLRHFDTEITHWLKSHHIFLPKLHTLALSWFPEWTRLQAMLLSIGRHRRSLDAFTLKLPAHPHPFIKKPIVLALNGIDMEPGTLIPGRDPLNPYDPFNFSDTDSETGLIGQYGTNYGSGREDDARSIHGDNVISISDNVFTPSRRSSCYFCWISFLDCSMDHDKHFDAYCSQHSTTDLVGITKDTAVEFDED